MRNLLALVGAATVTFLAVGWYLGWYQISSRPSSAGQSSLHVDINPGKITDDVKKGVEKGGEIVDHLRDKTKDDPKSSPGPASNFFNPSPTDGKKPGGASRPDDGSGVFGLRYPRD